MHRSWLGKTVKIATSDHTHVTTARVHQQVIATHGPDLSHMAIELRSDTGRELGVGTAGVTVAVYHQITPPHPQSRHRILAAQIEL